MSLASGKAAGTDGFPPELFKKLGTLSPQMANLFSNILAGGEAPLPPLRLCIAPLDKPGGDPSLRKAERPISLINFLAKDLEAAVLNRILLALEPLLAPSQFAYRRARGNDLQLVEVYDFVWGRGRADRLV